MPNPINEGRSIRITKLQESFSEASIQQMLSTSHIKVKVGRMTYSMNMVGLLIYPARCNIRSISLTNKGRDSGRARKRNWKIALLAVVAAVVLGMGAITAVSMASSPAQQAVRFGGLGSAHEHAAFVVKIDGKQINFAGEKYQVISQYIHVENRVGTTIHKHASSAPFGEFLTSVGMNIANGCFVMDDGNRYCDTTDKKLRFFVNGAEQPKSEILSYVLDDDDRFLIIYGSETTEQIMAELSKLDALPIFRS
jgi:hypothetical protein